MLTPEDLDFALVEAIPLHRTLGLRVIHEGSPPGILLPRQDALANHLGDNAGAVVFAVAEAASAAMIFSTYESLAETYFAIPGEARLRFIRPASGDLVGRATPGPPAEAIARELEANGRASLPVEVTVQGADLRSALELTVIWSFRPVRAGVPSTLPRRPG